MVTFGADMSKLQELAAKREPLQADIDRLYAEWAELEALVEQFPDVKNL